MDFNKFANKIEQQFNKMSKSTLYTVNLEPDEVWDKYINSFPEGTNNIYRERREYDCSCCKSFIRRIGNVVSIKNGKLISVWDVDTEGYYQIVSDVLSKFIKESTIDSIFISKESKAGAKTTKELLDSGSIRTWSHFHCNIPSALVNRDRATIIGETNGTKDVFVRGLKELTIESLEIVSELIDQNSLYRGMEFKNGITSFLDLKRKYDKSKNKDIFIWENIKKSGARIRNTAIGTLLQDISKNIDLTIAVKSFEDKVSGTNYKRTTALVTEGMKKNALKTIKELGIEDSLHRRYAHIEDISVNNVLFSDKTTTSLMKDSIDLLLDSTVSKSIPKNFDKLEEINIDDFIRTILPKSETIEVMFENKHTSNLVSLIAPSEPASPNILKWNNNFSWSYSGEITDSMKQLVKDAGGDITGVLRFSIKWNEEQNDPSNDLDAHCRTPSSHIYFSKKTDGNTGGLDVDITRPGSKVAVENITWQNINEMEDGTYNFYVKNYSGRNTNGFRAEIEFDGKIHSYNYSNSVTSDVPVAIVTLKNNQFSIEHKLNSADSVKTEWNIETNNFHKVKTIMYSPNYWDDNKEGNKHLFFMIDNCINRNPTRGLYNEFLDNKLTEHRKVFEVLGSKLKCQPDDNQLSGLGFSSTVHNELIVKVSGTFNRTLKIKF